MARNCDGCGSRMPPFFPRHRAPDGEGMLCNSCRDRAAIAKNAAAAHLLKQSNAPVTTPETTVVNGQVFQMWPYYDKAGSEVYVTGGFVKHPLCGAEISYESPGPMQAWMERHSRSDGAFGSCRLLNTASKVAHDSGDGETLYHCPFCGGGQLLGRSDGTAECQFCGTSFTVQVQPSRASQPQTIDGEPVDMPDMPGTPGDEVTTTELAPGEGEDDMDDQGVDPASSDKEPPQNPFGTEKKPNPFQSYRTASGALLDESEYIRHLAIRHAPDRGEVLAKVRESRLDEAFEGLVRASRKR